MAEENQDVQKNLLSKNAFRRAFSRIYDIFVPRRKGYGLSKNDFNDSCRMKLESLENYKLPPATDKDLGGVIPGDGLKVDKKGRVSVEFPDHSIYATHQEVKKDNNAIEVRFIKIENAAKQKQNEDDAYKKHVAEKVGLCESRIEEVNKATQENLKRFDNYLTVSTHDADMQSINTKLSSKADSSIVKQLLDKKVTKSNLDGSLINLLDTIRTEQETAAADRANLRKVKSDIASLNNLHQLVQDNIKNINYISQNIEKYITADSLKGFVLAEPGKGLSERSFTNADWERLQKLHNYTLLPANKIDLGGVKAGDNVDIAEDGTISVKVPTIDNFISKAESKNVTDALDKRISGCEDKSAKQENTVSTMSSDLSTTKDRVTALEDTAKNQAKSIANLAAKDDVTKHLDALNKSKLGIDEFKRYTATKIGMDNLNADVNNKLNRTIQMSVDIDTLKSAIKSTEADAVRCIDRINKLNQVVDAIRADIPDDKTYVKALPGKRLTTNDFTDKMRDKLSTALTINDIGNTVVGLTAGKKIDASFLPDTSTNLKFVENIEAQAEGSEDILYFNKMDKKTYYYDGMNFHPVHDTFYNDNGVDMRTEMADLYVNKSAMNKTSKDIQDLQDRLAKLEQALKTEKQDENDAGKS